MNTAGLHRLTAPPLTTHGGLGDLELWCGQQDLWPVLGTDEVGRGPLAGPVVAAAVVLGPAVPQGLGDSKKLSEAERERLAPRIEASALAFAVEPAWEAEIDARNILGASLAAMLRACERVAGQLRAAGQAEPGVLLIDGSQPVRDWRLCPQVTVVKGDSRSLAVAAASILAKVWRDRHMLDLERLYPGYGFAQHKGYPTPEHLQALRRLGPCPVHRRSFGPVRQLGLFDHDG